MTTDIRPLGAAAPGDERSARAGGSVVVPAHNEEAVLARGLSALSPLTSSGEIEVIVSCNGCTDRTAEIARSFAGVTVLESPVGSKPAALDAADAVATRWPRVYLDADVVMPPTALRALLRHLSELPEPRAARPPFHYDTAGASAPVRAYYRARVRIPETSAGLWGAGVYALNERARASFDTFPAATADDLFVDSLFAAGTKTVVDTEPVVVATPRTLSTLLAVLRRTYRGNAEMRSAGLLANRPAASSSTLLSLLRRSRRPGELLDAAVYVVLAVVSRLQAARTRDASWERDDSSRVPSTGTGTEREDHR